MPDYLKAQDIEDLRATGVKLSTAAERFRATIERLRSDIDSHEGTDSWGADKYGHEFTKQYYGDGKDGRPADDATTNLLSSIDRARKAGDAVLLAMDHFLATDGANAQSIRKPDA
jgi:hypothetical protein